MHGDVREHVQDATQDFFANDFGMLTIKPNRGQVVRRRRPDAAADQRDEG